MTPHEIIADAVKRAKLRRSLKCLKCDKPTCTNLRGTPIKLCKEHYKEAIKDGLCLSCYKNQKHPTQSYCLQCKLQKDSQRPKRNRTKRH